MKISAISISDRKGIRKKNIDAAILVKDFGIQDDAHGGDWHRQVSFLAQESIDTMRQKGLDVVAGNFAENITTTGIDLTLLPVGTHLQIGATELIISQLGKVCHNKCAIYHQAGDCVMPREGIFGVVRKGGRIVVGDSITILSQLSLSAAVIVERSLPEDECKELAQVLAAKTGPAFVRIDKLNGKGDNMNEILNDLIYHQKINRIVIFDPNEAHQLALLNYQKNEYQTALSKENSLIFYCRQLREVQNLG